MRWVDVNPRQWFYRSVLESNRMYLDRDKEETLFEGKLYNVFEEGNERIVRVVTSTEGQKEFNVPGFKPDSRNEVSVYVEGKYVPPSQLEEGKIHLPSPIGGDQEVVILVSGIPRIIKQTCDPYSDEECVDGTCRETPLLSGCDPIYPRIGLSKRDEYTYNVNYSMNEVAVCLGTSLKRVHVDRMVGETIQEALARVIGNKQNLFTIINGVIYVSFHLNRIPVYVNYNYIDEESGGIVKNMRRERAIPSSGCALYNDRFFPSIQVTRAEYFVLLQRMRENFYNRYTDRGYHPTNPELTQRDVKDRTNIINKWYAEEVLNILDEKFLDGCYVFPLFEDNTFNPDSCVTRAEAVVYLHRFTEWALERFR